MTREKAIVLLNKLCKKDFNSTQGSEYASGLAKGYYQAARYLGPEPYLPDNTPNKGIASLGDILKQLHEDMILTHAYILPFLQDNLIGKDINTKAVIKQLQYYLGRINALKAALKIIGKIK